MAEWLPQYRGHAEVRAITDSVNSPNGDNNKIKQESETSNNNQNVHARFEIDSSKDGGGED